MRNRKDSERKFFQRAREIYVLTNRLMVDERVVPKRYRLTNAVPTMQTARSIFYNLRRGEEFYPSSQENVTARRRYYSLAIADCRQLMTDLECYVALRESQGAWGGPDDGGFPGKDRICELAEAVGDEIGLIQGARKRTVLRQRRPKPPGPDGAQQTLQ